MTEPARAVIVILSVLAKDLPSNYGARSFASTLRMTAGAVSHFVAGFAILAPAMPTSPNTAALLERAKQVLIPNYARVPVVMDRGQSVRLWDTDGKEYLDL